MPPITGARTAPITLAPTPQSIQPSRRPQGLVFKAAQGLAKRMRPWQPGARAASHEPFTLLRGEHAARMNRAARCRDRIAAAAGQLCGTAVRLPDADQLAQLEQDEAKLRDQTQVHASMRGVLLDRAVRAYLPDSDARTNKQRGKALIKARQRLAGVRRSTSPALDAVGHVLESATALQACAGPVKALGRGYRDGGGRIQVSAQTVHDLLTLLDGMKMLRRHDQDAGDFLYPAVRALHEADSGRADGTALLALLRDLGGSHRDDPRSLRAQLTRHGGALDFLLSNDFASNGPPRAATRQGLVDDMNRLLDGLASAGRQVWRETLEKQVPAWAADAQAGLFQEARLLYGSAQRWRKRGLAHGSEEEILRASPAHAVGILLERAANEALATPSAPAGNLAPLLGGLQSRLGRTAERIEQALGAAAVHSTPDDIADLRQALMRGVLEETGILGEIHRLRESGGEPAARASPVPPVSSRAASGRMPPALRPDSGQMHPRVRQGVKNAEAYAKRQIVNVAAACRQAGDKPLSRHTLQALNNAYAGLVGQHGESAPGVWKRLLDGEAMRLKDSELQRLNGSALCAHVDEFANLTSKVADSDARAASDELLGDLRTSIRCASARRDAGAFLKTWCASLSAPAGMADGAALLRQAEELRDRIGKLDDGTVKSATLLNAVVQPLGNAELDALLAALAAHPALDMATLPAPGMAHTASATTHATVPGATAGSPAPGTAPLADATSASASPDTGGLGATSATRASETGILTLPKRLLRYLLGESPPPNEGPDIPARPQVDIHTFLGRLYDTARIQAETRMESLRDSLVQDYRTTLFTQVGLFHALLDTPEGHTANGPAAATLERLIRDAANQGQLLHQYGEGSAAATALAGMRFLRTTHGYDVVRDLTLPLARATAALHARLDAGMKDVGIPRFRSDTAAATWRDAAVEQILRETQIFERLDYAVWRHTPPVWRHSRPDLVRQADTPRLANIGLRASLRRGAARASTKSTQSVDRDGFAKPKSIFQRTETARAPAIAENAHAIDRLSIGALARRTSVATTVHDDDRASTVISDDSGFDEYGGSQMSLDSPRHDTLHASVPPMRTAPPPPTSDTRIARNVDPQLAAALRAALEQRNRDQWNRA